MKSLLCSFVLILCPYYMVAQPNSEIVQQTNSDFSNGTTGWNFWTNDTGRGEFSVSEGRGQIKVIVPGQNVWSVGVSNPNITIEKGMSYKVDFTGMADPPIGVDCGLRLDDEPWTAYSGQRVFQLTNKFEEYSFTFTMTKETDRKAVFQIQCGGQAKSYIIFDNVKITKITNDKSTQRIFEKAVVKVSRSGGIPISPFAFGNCYHNWVDWAHDGRVGLKGSEEAVKALNLDVVVAANNQNDENVPELFDNAQIDKYIQYCRDVGAEPIMIVPVHGNNIDGGPTSAQMAADIVTYVNGTKDYGVTYWSVGCEVDIYDIFFERTNRKEELRVKSAQEYADIIKSYSQAMIDANNAVNSGIELKFVGPELGWRYLEGNDWLSPILDECKDYIDVVSIHAYGLDVKDLSPENIFNNINHFHGFIKDQKARIARHANPGTALAITEANVSWEWDPKIFPEGTLQYGPGTFYAAIWDADRMGAALEEGLWNFSFWTLAETLQAVEANNTVFGFIRTDQTKDPPTCILTPEYYAQQMVTTNFSGTAVIPENVPESMSVYASYDPEKAATKVLVINKTDVERILDLIVDDLSTQTIIFKPMSINIVTIADDEGTEYQLLEYTIKMADAGRPPKTAR